MGEKIQLPGMTKELGHSVIYYSTIDSTNEEVKRLARAGAKNGLVVLAGSQSKGKGRRGRIWISPHGENLYLSILLRPPINIASVYGVTLVVALGVTEAIKKVTGLQPQIKWPNDIVVEGKKIGGILTELELEESSGYFVVVGIGINVNMKVFPEELQDKATSLVCMCQNKEVDLSTLGGSILEELEKRLPVFYEQKSLGAFQQEYEDKMVNLGKMVHVIDGADSFWGIATGIDLKGRLKVKHGEKIELIASGEVSVRGVYGYV